MGPMKPPAELLIHACKVLEDVYIGPAPATEDIQELAFADTVRAIEERSRQMKEHITCPREEKVGRDTWMLELPEKMRKNFGTGARTFKRTTTEEVGDQSAWTETPADRARKLEERLRGGAGAEPAEAAEPAGPTRDAVIAHQVASYNAVARPVSLMDMHQEKQKRKRQEDEQKGETTRRAFDRETDLEIRKLDPRKKSDLLKSAAGFNSRFTHSKFQ